MFDQTWRFIWTSGIAKLNAFCDWCSSVAYCNAVRLWVVSMVDSDGSVDDPDAPNQITEGSRRQPFYTFCFRFVLNAHNPRKLMPSVSSTNRQHDHIAQGEDGNVGREWWVTSPSESLGGWPTNLPARQSHQSHKNSFRREGFQIHKIWPLARYFTLTTPLELDSMYHLWQFSKISWQKVRSNKRGGDKMRSCHSPKF